MSGMEEAVSQDGGMEQSSPVLPQKDRVFKKAKRLTRMNSKEEAENGATVAPATASQGFNAMKNSRKSRSAKGRGLPKKGETQSSITRSIYVKLVCVYTSWTVMCLLHAHIMYITNSISVFFLILPLAVHSDLRIACIIRVVSCW